MLAHGFTIALMAQLIRAGLAIDEARAHGRPALPAAKTA